jgi:hypothetical protein
VLAAKLIFIFSFSPGRHGKYGTDNIAAETPLETATTLDLGRLGHRPQFFHLSPGRFELWSTRPSVSI